uniref:NADH-ubiquinone oxidoreductase chain 6 n=1 Tax=Fundulopanchax filamentosus TaxID=60261 RepID=A0A518LRA0_9TELE|nr:NADH dehydrogenase subunit 6 [Fundulopanchax filamentosus]QDV92699.1 NADH dehydrogenase subunit 6 [Fundulopanchax filamentosus]
MMYIIYLCLFSLILGLAAIASNPSPYFAALGLVVVAGAGCGMLASYGGSFLSLILFLIYLGGMLVVFGYSAALAAEPFPESLGNMYVLSLMMFYVFWVVLAGLLFQWGCFDGPLVFWDGLCDLNSFQGDMAGVALLYFNGGWMLVIGGWVLLLTLFVVLELTRGSSRGMLRLV